MLQAAPTGQTLTPLAVLTPHVGLVSETFIARHCNDLLPAGTSVVSFGSASEAQAWRPAGPLRIIRSPAIPPRPWWWSTRLLSEVTRRPRRLPPVSRRTVDEVRAFLIENGVQVVLAEYLDSWLPFLPAIRAEGIRFFAHGHGYDVSVRLSSAYWREQYGRLNDAHGVVTVSSLSAERIRACGVRPELLSVIPCGVHVPDEHLTRPAGGLSVLAVGRFVAKKGPLQTIESFKRVLEHVPEAT